MKCRFATFPQYLRTASALAYVPLCTSGVKAYCGRIGGNITLVSACRQLGFTAATEALSNAFFGAGDASMPIWLDDVDCYGSEATITECLIRDFGVHNCRHGEDAGVRCYCESLSSSILLVFRSVKQYTSSIS